MSIPDALMPQWYRLAAGAQPDEVSAIESGLDDGSLHPGASKRELARRIVDRYWGEGAGTAAEATFDRLFRDKEAPEDVPEHPLGPEGEIWLPALLAEAGLAPSNAEARRLIAQGAVKVDGERLVEEDVSRDVLAGHVVQVGKRRFVRFV
jgi:tyrosyl-tRNA synthetase